ncbi:MAG: helix-turn-helix transcriptional regulator [Bacteroidia bacterium]
MNTTKANEQFMITKHEKIDFNGKLAFETISTDADQIFNFKLEKEAYFVHVKHGNHTAITPSEVIEVTEGNLSFSVGENLILKAITGDKGIYQATIIHIDREAILSAFAKKFPEIESAKENDFSRDIITGRPCVLTQNYIHGIMLYFNNRHIITEDIIRLKQKEILHLLLRSKKAEQVAKMLEGFVNRNTTSFKNTVENHLLSDISIEELAHLCNMSHSTFKRHFKKIYGQSPSDYIFQQRIEISKKMLATSQDSIEDIAFNTGFKTVSHFSRKFKETYGIPPSQYKLTSVEK